MKTYDSDKLGKVTVPDSPVTKNIAGHEITLKAGQRYIASRPFNERGRTVYPVSIHRVINSPNKPAGVDVVVDDLTYDQAIELVNAFNNGTTSFEGRVW